jgi:4-diphosphocytidyl-2-C-methyl-D-erythritol kinase
MTRGPAPAKLNLALVVGPAAGADGRHELTTVLQRVDLCDRVELRAAPALQVGGFDGDTLVTAALQSLAAEAGVEPRWAASIGKRIPVAAGLGGGSSDAATALRLANATLARPLAHEALHRLAAKLGADVPFFLQTGPQLGEDDGTRLSALDLPQDYWVVIVLPAGARKPSTAAVYREFDERAGAEGYGERRRRLLAALAGARRPRDLAALPPNDLGSPALAACLLELGAFRADVTGAGPALYGLYLHEGEARAAARRLRTVGQTWITVPCWYG